MLFQGVYTSLAEGLLLASSLVHTANWLFLGISCAGEVLAAQTHTQLADVWLAGRCCFVDRSIMLGCLPRQQHLSMSAASQIKICQNM